MKTVCTTLLSFILFQMAFGQNAVEKDIMIDGKERYYTMVTPSDYSANQEYPLVISLHGYYQYISTYRALIGLDSMAEKEKFIVAYPMGGIVQLTTNPLPNCLMPEGVGWAANGYFKQKHGHNDETFLLDLMEQLEKDYSIDKSRIYIMGISNGGFMASKMAAKYPEKFAAAACWRLVDSTQATASVPIMVSLGGKDPIGNIKGWSLGFTKWNDLKNNWLKTNNCDTNATVVELEDIDNTDGSTVTLHKYSGTESNEEFWLYMENNGGHLMPHQALIDRCPELGEGNRDYKTGETTWNFLKRHTKEVSASINSASVEHSVYPNPASSVLTVSLPNASGTSIQIIDINGKVLQSQILTSGTTQINISGLNLGMYFYQIQTAKGTATGKIMIER